MKKPNYLLWISLIVVALIIGGIIGNYLKKDSVNVTDDFNLMDYKQTNHKILTSDEKFSAGFSPDDVCAGIGDYRYCGINALERWNDGYTIVQCFCYKTRFALLEETYKSENA